MKRFLLALTLLTPTLSLAVGYRIPEQSIRSTGTAYVRRMYKLKLILQLKAI